MDTQAIPPAIHAAEQHLRAGRLRQAEGLCRQVLTRNPHQAFALHLLGIVARRTGNTGKAVELIRRAIQVNATVSFFHNSLGEIYLAMKRGQDAAVCFQEAIRLTPNFAVAHYNLGLAVMLQNKPEEAIGYFETAIRLQPNLAEAHFSLGNTYRKLGKTDEAILSYEMAIRLKPDFPFAHMNLGVLMRKLGKPKEAIARLDHVLRLQPDYADAHWNLSLALLYSGDFARGWNEYEWRFRRNGSNIPKKNFPQPLWDGTPLDGRTILLWDEQGFGDTIQFIRFAPLVAARGGRVLVECHPEVKTLLQTGQSTAEVIARGEPLPPFEVHCALLGLPRILQTTLETIPAAVPYLRADPLRAETWGTRLKSAGAKLKVGIAWRGRKNPDPYRTCPLRHFAPLTGCEGVTFYGLQKDDPENEAAAPPAPMNFVNCASDLHDFTDTAALVSQMDLVISIDTAVAHLAGALGGTVWTLLPCAPDFRWLQDREDCAWYPTMRLFRQRARGDWEEVMQRVAAALQEHMRR